MKRRILRVTLYFAILFFFYFPQAALPGPGATENVIIAIIDGIRYEEVTSEYMPFTLGGIDPATGLAVPDPLKPQGTLYTNFYNTGLTGTTPGHQTIITGVRQLLMNNKPIESRQRTKQPNLFEYYRKQIDIPIQKTWIVAGKQGNLKYLDYSLHPDYGYAYRSSIYREDDAHLFSPEDVEGYHPSDDQIREVAFDRMDSYHPSLMLINLKDVDAEGHTGNFEKYTQAIKRADKIVYDLWQKIQSDSYYQNTTTLIITTDHGRHSDGIGTGFKSHGGYSRGDRHLIFLAIGPDIKQNTVIDTKRDQTDIAPTVGALLGFQTPYAEGLVMEEMFSNPDLNNPNLGTKIITGGARKPKMAVNQDGIHLVWSEKNGQEWDVYYKRSHDGGLTWTEPVILFQSDDENFFYEADIAAGPRWIHVAATAYASADSGGNTYAWKLYSKWGNTSGDNTFWVGDEVVTDLKTMLGSPSISTSDTTTCITITEKGNKLWSFNGFYTNWTAARIDSATQKTKNIVGYAIATNQQDTYALWPAIFNTKNQETTAEQRKWNLYFDKYNSANASWGADDWITSNTGERYFFYDPAIVLNENGLLRAVWARFVDKEDGTGKWKIFYQGTSDGGATWSPEEPTRLSDNNMQSWNPDITYLERSQAPALVVWEAHDQGISEICGRLKQGGKWHGRFALTDGDGFDSVEPDIAGYQGAVYLTWQDIKSGNWEIEFKTAYLTFDLHLPAGWSMISLPVIPESTSVSNLFPDAVVVYGYEKGRGYVRIRDDEELEAGKGYWILSDQERSYAFTGQPILSYTPPVSSDGWAMIGGCSSSAQVSSNNCNIGVIYRYVQGAGYQRVTGHVEPGEGYWILLKDVTDQASLSVQGTAE